MTFKRFLLCLLMLAGVVVGWAARGANDGNRIESEVKVEVDKAEAIERARWEKQIRDLDLKNGELQDKLAVASARETKIDNLLKEIEELKAKLPAADKSPATPATEPAEPKEPKSEDLKPGDT
jgi:hypothetical protein